MPHFKLWHFAPELSDYQRQLLAVALEAVAVDVLGVAPDSVSVDEVSVESDRWKTEVFDVEIMPRHGALVRQPGYSM